MNGLRAGEPDQRTLCDRGSGLLDRLGRDPEMLPGEFRRPSGRGRRANHGSYALYRGPGLFVSAVVWGPGDRVGPHDHQTWGMIGVMGNGIQETRYRRVDDRDREGFAILEQDRSMLVKPGDVSLLVPEIDEIHRMDNDTDRPTVEIHVYGHDLVALPEEPLSISLSHTLGVLAHRCEPVDLLKALLGQIERRKEFVYERLGGECTEGHAGAGLPKALSACPALHDRVPERFGGHLGPPLLVEVRWITCLMERLRCLVQVVARKAARARLSLGPSDLLFDSLSVSNTH